VLRAPRLAAGVPLRQRVLHLLAKICGSGGRSFVMRRADGPLSFRVLATATLARGVGLAAIAFPAVTPSAGRRRPRGASGPSSSLGLSPCPAQSHVHDAGERSETGLGWIALIVDDEEDTVSSTTG
jgi:hypothetical protein